MIPLSEIKVKAAKKNQEAFNNNFYFSSKFSIYLSYIFINLGLSPNQVTFIFFLCGLVGAFLLIPNTLPLVIIAFILYRMHVIIDLCDGEVARFTKKFSLNGTYYDYMIHAILYPLWIACMGIAQYLHWDNVTFLYLAIAGAIVASLTMSVKNNYFRALYSNNKVKKDVPDRKLGDEISKTKLQLYNVATDLLSFDGLVLAYVVIFFIDVEILSLAVLAAYILLFLLLVATKFYLFSTKGGIATKS